MEIKLKQRKTTSILIAMFAIFGFCWLPQNLLMVFDDYTSLIEESGNRFFLYLVCHCISMLTIPINPLLYAWLNSTYRKLLAAMLKCKKPSLTNANASELASIQHKTSDGNDCR